MSEPNEFTIICYLAWCGAEATYKFSDKGRYDKALAFLNSIAEVQVHGEELPPEYARITNDFYVIEDSHRTAFKDFMRDAVK